MTALHFAAREGHRPPVRALVEGGANVNLVSGGEQTSPIVEAIINGHLDLAAVPARPRRRPDAWPTSTA